MIQIFVVINEETLEDRSLGFIADEIEKIYPEADLCISRVADETNVEVFNSDHKDLIKEEVLWVIHRLVLEEQLLIELDLARGIGVFKECLYRKLAICNKARDKFGREVDVRGVVSAIQALGGLSVVDERKNGVS